MKVYFIVGWHGEKKGQQVLRLLYADEKDGFQPRVGRRLSQKFCEDRGFEDAVSDGVDLTTLHVFPPAVSRELEQLQQVLEEVNVDISEVLQPVIDAAVRVIKKRR